MVDKERLREAIADSGMTMTAVARKSGMHRAVLYNRLAGRGQMTVDEMAGLSQALRLTARQREKIFFAEKVD